MWPGYTIDTIISEGRQISKGDRVYGGVEWSVIRRDYVSVAEVIDTAPPTWKESRCVFDKRFADL